MQAEPTLADDEEPPESVERGSFELSASEEAELSQIASPCLRKHLRSIREGIARKEQARAESRASEPEEKPFELPLVDEEALAKIADPHEREERRREKIRMYKEHPDALRHYMEISERLKAERAKRLRLPVIPQETRPAVNDLARSSLFAAVQGKDRQRFVDEKLAVSGETQLSFTGEQLNQDDHDLLMQLVFLASQHPIGETVTVSAHSILKALGRCTGKSQHDQLRGEFKRLVEGTVNLQTPKIEYFGHLVDDARQHKESRLWGYRVNPLMGLLFSQDSYTLIDWEQRKALKGKDLARWLQLQLATHAQPFPMKVETIRRLSGSRTKELYAFRQNLKAALDDLKTRGIIAAWHIDENDKAHVDRGDATSASQQRHLIRNAPKPRKPKP